MLASFKAGDVNKDGTLSLGEVSGIYKGHFERSDTNHNGTLSPADMPGPVAGKAATFKQTWAKMDTNHDGTIELSEYSKYEDKLFAPLFTDAKKDGSISWANVVSFYKLKSVFYPEAAKKAVKPIPTVGLQSFGSGYGRFSLKGELVGGSLLLAVLAGGAFLVRRRRIAVARVFAVITLAVPGGTLLLLLQPALVPCITKRRIHSISPSTALATT